MKTAPTDRKRNSVYAAQLAYWCWFACKLEGCTQFQVKI